MIGIKYELEILENNTNMSVGEYVYSLIKENIINWNLKPGTRMSEKEISEVLNVSRTPVREAFIKISKEGLLEILPQRGTLVSKIDLIKVEEERFLRESLEVSVLNLAVESFPEDFSLKLEDNLKKQAECIETVAYKKFFELDEKFHKALFIGVNKQRCWDVIQVSTSQHKRIRVLTFFDKEKIKSLVDEHKTIFDAVCEKNKEKAETIMKKHLKKLLVEEERIKAEYPEYIL